jgi:hypothetical protein
MLAGRLKRSTPLVELVGGPVEGSEAQGLPLTGGGFLPILPRYQRANGLQGVAPVEFFGGRLLWVLRKLVCWSDRRV